MKGRPHTYLTHPLGPRNGEDVYTRQNNIASAIRWVRFCVEALPWVVNAPWLTFLLAVVDEAHRPRSLIDQYEILFRCEVLTVCGGHISRHMKIDRDRHLRHDKPIMDLNWLGHHAPLFADLNDIDRLRLKHEIKTVDQHLKRKAHS